MYRETRVVVVVVVVLFFYLVVVSYVQIIIVCVERDDASIVGLSTDLREESLRVVIDGGSGGLGSHTVLHTHLEVALELLTQLRAFTVGGPAVEQRGHHHDAR